MALLSRGRLASRAESVPFRAPAGNAGCDDPQILPWPPLLCVGQPCRTANNAHADFGPRGERRSSQPPAPPTARRPSSYAVSPLRAESPRAALVAGRCAIRYVVGDDLLMSDLECIKCAINTCNTLTLKANQVGTVTEAIEAVKQAKDAHWGVMVSYRYGDTDDSFIADPVVGATAGQIKAGAPCCGECLTKYNQLLRIEEELGSEGVYAGKNWRTTPS